MTMEMASRIAPPPEALFKLIKNIKSPFVVTPNGVVPPSKIFKALGELEGKGKGKLVPVLPGKKDLLDKIKIIADPKKIDPKQIIRPLGKKEDLLKIKEGKLTEPKKPLINPEKIIKKFPKGLEDKIKIKKDSLSFPTKPSGLKDSKTPRPNIKIQDPERKPKEIKPIFKKEEKEDIKQGNTKIDSVKPKEIKPIFKRPEDRTSPKMDSTPKIIKQPGSSEKIYKKSDEPSNPVYKPVAPKEKFIQVNPSGGGDSNKKIYTPPQDQGQNKQQPLYKPKGSSEEIRFKAKQPEVQSPIRVYKKTDSGRRNKNDN